MQLIRYISSLITISPDLEQALKKASESMQIPKHQLITRAGERISYLYFVEKGLLRGYYFEDGKEITNWFAQENEFATCFYAFIGGQASFENIQAMEDTLLIRISAESLKNLYETFPETERIGRLITEAYYMKLEERLLNIRFRAAKERYHNLVESRPQLIQRASLGQIASYLGITQETLSRIRSES